MNEITTRHSFRCDLNAGTLEVTLDKALMHQDALGDVFSVSVWRSGSPVELDGVTVRGYLYLAATQQTVLLNGSASGSSASVTLDSSCYAVPGHASLVIQLQKGTVRHTVLKANFVIDRTCTDTVIDPSNVLPTLPELLAQIAAMEQATAKANAAAANADAAREGIQGDLAALTEEIADVNSAFSKTAKNRRKYLKGNPSANVVYRNAQSVNKTLAGLEKDEMLDRIESMIDTVDAVNYYGCVSFAYVEFEYPGLVTITPCFYDDFENSVAQSSFTSETKPTFSASLSTLEANDYCLYIGVLYANHAVKVKFNPRIKEWLSSFVNNERVSYNVQSADVGYYIDGFVPANVTNKNFNNGFPAFNTYRNKQDIYAVNDAIVSIQLKDGYMGSIGQFNVSDGVLTFGFDMCEVNDTLIVDNSASSYLSIYRSFVLENLDDISTLHLFSYDEEVVALTIDKTKLLPAMSVGSNSSGANKTAVTIPVDKFKAVKYSYLFNGYYDNSGIMISDNNYATYIAAINKDCKKALITMNPLEHSKIVLCNENATIQRMFLVSAQTTLVDVEGYSYIAWTTSYHSAVCGLQATGYDEEKAIRSVLAFRKTGLSQNKQVGTYNMTKGDDGTVYTDEMRSIASYPDANSPFLKVEEVTASFTNPADGRTYSNNYLMEICKDGTHYYFSLREDGASDSYFFPIIWKQKGDEKSLVMGTDTDTPADATILTGANYPNLSGVKWLVRSSNTLYQNYDSIKELSNGELLICLSADISDGEQTTFTSVVFVTIDNRTKWVPKFMCTNEKQTYNGSTFDVGGYPTKNNCIQVFKTEYDTERDCILICEYGKGTPAYWKEKGVECNALGVVGKVWMSVNSGETFKKIFDLDEKINGDADDISDNNWKWCKSYEGRMGMHLHCAYYDSVNKMVWISNGDGSHDDARNSLFYLDMNELFGWCTTQGTAVSAKNFHPTYIDNEELPPFKAYVINEEGRDITVHANALSKQANYQIYSMIATEKALILGNDTARHTIFGVHNNRITHKRNQSSPNLFIDIFAEFDEDDPNLVIGGFPQCFYRKDENTPILCFFSGLGIFASWDGVKWRNVYANTTKTIGFTTHVVEDTDGRIIFVYPGGLDTDYHNWKILNY